MNRRAFISLIGAAGAAWPQPARAQDRVRTVGVIMIYAEADPEGQARFSALREGLHKLGWAEGSKIQVQVRWAAGKPDLMRGYAAELVGLPADVIVVHSTPFLAAVKQLTSTIPIVFAQVADPISSGFVGNYARPGGNITGFTDFDASIAGKWMELLKEAVPSLNGVTVLLDPKQTNHQAFLRVIESAAASVKLQVSATAVQNRPEIERAMTALAGQAGRGVVVLPGPVNNTSRDSIIQSAAGYRLPAVYPLKYCASDGGLLSYGIDQIDQWHRVAGYVDRILRGEKAGELPVQAPTKYELAINLKTARALGLEVPPTLLARADEVIE